MRWLGGSQWLPVGAQAPAFGLPDQQGRVTHLYELLESSWVVLFFYPKDASPVCTRQVCQFRDVAAEFQALRAKLLGISEDSVASHRDFASQCRLNYPILSDAGGHVQKAYGVSKLLGLLPERVTFIIGPDRRIQFVYSNPLSAQAHVEQALTFLQQQTMR